jgi:hypothetical protein
VHGVDDVGADRREEDFGQRARGAVAVLHGDDRESGGHGENRVRREETERGSRRATSNGSMYVLCAQIGYVSHQGWGVHIL